MRPALVLGLLMLLAAQSPSPVAWMKANAVPLTTVVAGNGFADMRPLAKLIGNARIVALGEATHGSREFFQLKHRMLEFLATEMGFTIFSIEANMPEASVYPEGQPFAFLSPLAAAEAFDALLFVDTTTAARKNPGR
jgi:erythromycin esterase-like protein